MGDRSRELLAIEVIVVTYFAALRSFTAHQDPDLGRDLAERARARALELLDAAGSSLRYLPDSPLDRAMLAARCRIEESSLSRD